MLKSLLNTFHRFKKLLPNRIKRKKKNGHWSTATPPPINDPEIEIKEHLIDVKECQENLKKLKETFVKTDFVSFIGAGTSELTGVPSWESLVDQLCKKANIQFNENDNLIVKASEAKSALKKTGKLNAYYECLEEQMRGLSTGGTKFHLMVVNIFDRHITTNFDSIAYNHYKEKKGKGDFQAIPNLDFKRFKNKEKPFVFLHGYIGGKFVILEEEIYNHYYPAVSDEWGSKEIELFLKEVCKNFSVVFFGVSFSDDYLHKTFRKVILALTQDTATNSSNRPHFLIVDESALNMTGFNLIDLNKKIKNIDMQNLKTIFIKQDYIDNEGNFRIEKFHDFLKFTHSNGSLQIYIQNLGKKVYDWFENFHNINVFPIVYKKKAHIFIENVLSAVSSCKER